MAGHAACLKTHISCCNIRNQENPERERERAMEVKIPSLLFFLALTLGSISVFNTLTLFLRWVWITFLRPAKNLRDYGSWALITGSTDGIGKALAFAFAENGLNLVLLGRNPKKLQSVSAEILERFKGIHVKTMVLDLSKDVEEEEVRTRVEKGIEGLDVGILINNAGTTYPHAMFFHEVGFEILRDLISVNIKGTTWVTRAVLPGMLRKKKGAIVNLGSGSASVVPSFPLLAVYSATKSYIDQFSRSLYVEYKHHGIDIQCQVPLYVATKMVKVVKRSMFVPTPETYAKSSVRWIGYEPRCLPYWPHSFQCWITSMLPEVLLDRWLFTRYLEDRRIKQAL